MRSSLSSSIYLILILVSSLFTIAAAVRHVPPDSKMSLDGHFMLPKGSLGNNPIVRSPGGNSLSIPRIGGSTASRSFIQSPGGNAVSSPGGDGLGHLMLPKRSLGYNSILRTPGGNSVSIPGIGGSTTSRSFVGSPGGNAVYIPVGHFMLHKRSLGYIPIVRSPGGDNMLAASGLPSPLPPSAYVVEREPPSKPSPPTCFPRC